MLREETREICMEHGLTNHATTSEVGGAPANFMTITHTKDIILSSDGFLLVTDMKVG